MKVKITAKAPTAYQYQSLQRFRLGAKPIAGGYWGELHFPTVREARQYLRDRAAAYYEEDRAALRRHLGKNALTIDAVTAYITPLND
jgi:hypothetical protein